MTTSQQKRCSKCGTLKSLEEFNKNAGRKDGLRGECRSCQIENQRLYRKANPVMVKTEWMVRGARKRAGEKQLPFSIDHHFVRSIAPSHCPIFNVPLEWDMQLDGAGPHPNSPSLDRIDPTKGYTKDNVWIISYRANTIKSNASHEELKLVTEAVGLAIVDSLDW